MKPSKAARKTNAETVQLCSVIAMDESMIKMYIYDVFILQQVCYILGVESYICIRISECETFNAAKSLFFLYSHVLDIISPWRWFCALDCHSKTLI